jgi:hypothetical protein
VTIAENGSVTASITLDDTPTLWIGNVAHYAVTGGYIQFGDGADSIREVFKAREGAAWNLDENFFQFRDDFTDGSSDGAIDWSLTTNLPGFPTPPTFNAPTPLETRFVNGNTPVRDAFNTSRPHIVSLSVRTAPVPEPGAWMMMMLGFAAIGGAARRRRSAEARLDAC